MGNRDDSEPAPSLAGLSEAGVATTTSAPPFATVEDERYREVRVVGTGGLGTVLLAHDQRLDREVALKRIGPGADPRRAALRFAREARITARLDHAGIVPIHDAGVTADGRLYYTMRLVRGRSLAELTAEARDVAARLALVPAVTAACHAVAHAHRRRIVHRDLKPANVMVGDLGETQVVDWGLAEELAVLAELGDVEMAGTPAYLSPEIARGGAASIAADVWSLGATLYEVLAGRRLVEGDRDAVVAALRRGPAPPAWPDDVPAELRAIVARATAAAPGDRYADAEAMARDLEAYRDGRRVHAHRYSARELAWRAIVAWRWPLAVTAALVIATVTSLAVTARRTERQRVRAVAAEARAIDQRDRAERALVAAQAAAAVAALDQGYEVRAQELATDALARGPSPEARGVLAATLAAAQPRMTERIELPGCGRVVPVDVDAALCLEPDAVALWQVHPPTRRWTVVGPVSGARALVDAVVAWHGDELRVIDGGDGHVVHRARMTSPIVVGAVDVQRTRVAVHDRSDLLVVRAGGGPPQRQPRPCEDRVIDAIGSGEHTTWMVCASGQVRTISDEGIVNVLAETRFGRDLRPASVLSVIEDEKGIAIGGVGGDVEFHDLRSCFGPTCEDIVRQRLFTGVTTHAIRDVIELGYSAFVIPDDGDAVLLRWFASAETQRWPIPAAAAAIAIETDLVTGGRDWRRFVDRPGPPRRFVGSPGINVAAVWPDGSLVAAAGEDGTVGVWSTVDGQRVAGLEVGRGGVAILEPSPDGRELLVEKRGDHDGPRRQLWSVDGWRLVLDTEPRWPRAVAATPGFDVRRHVDDPAAVATTAVSADGRWAAAGLTTGWIEVWDTRSRAVIARMRGHRQRVSWLAFRDDALWSAGWDGAILRWSVTALTVAPAAIGRD